MAFFVKNQAFSRKSPKTVPLSSKKSIFAHNGSFRQQYGI
jgi:hypothetical protein